MHRDRRFAARDALARLHRALERGHERGGGGREHLAHRQTAHAVGVEAQERSGHWVREEEPSARVDRDDARANVAEDVLGLELGNVEALFQLLAADAGFLQARGEVCDGERHECEDDELEDEREPDRRVVAEQDVGEVDDVAERGHEEHAAHGQEERRADRDEDVQGREEGERAAGLVHDDRDEGDVEDGLEIAEGAPEAAAGGGIPDGPAGEGGGADERERGDERVDRVGMAPFDERGDEDRGGKAEAADVDPA